jgi:hypothetical protein
MVNGGLPFTQAFTAGAGWRQRDAKFAGATQAPWASTKAANVPGELVQPAPDYVRYAVSDLECRWESYLWPVTVPLIVALGPSRRTRLDRSPDITVDYPAERVAEDDLVLRDSVKSSVVLIQPH